MKKTVLLILFFAVSVSVLAQSKSMKNYYYWINQAELAICDSNYAYANECYDKAFGYHKPLARDVTIAYKLNTVFTGDTSRIYRYATQKLLWGQEDIALNYSKLSSYDTNIYHHLLYLEQTVAPDYDTVLRHKMEAILDRDQSYPHSPDNPKKDSLDYAVMKDIIDLYAHYKVINDYTAGFKAFEFYLYVPCLHYALSRKYNMQGILKKEVKKGNLSADKYMDLEDDSQLQMHYHSNSTCNFVKRPNGYGVVENITHIGDFLFVELPNDIRKVNKNRRRLGISETFEDFVRKMVWQFYTKTIQFYMIDRLTSGDAAEDAAEAAKWKREIDAEHAKCDFHRMYFEKPTNQTGN